MKIINFNKKYKEDLDKIQIEQWGEGSDSDDIFNNLNSYQIKLVKDNDSICGACVWHIKDENVCYIDFIIFKPEYQHIGLGRELMQIVVDYAKQNNCLKIECEVINACGKMNAKNLVETFGFIEKKVVKNYWGRLYPDFDCRECGHKPCVCTMHKYVLDL